jgi:hypothetical protein
MNIFMLMITPRAFASRSVYTIEVSTEDMLQLHYLAAHLDFYKALLLEFSAVSLPFDAEYFAPVVYDLVVRAADLHVFFGANRSNVLFHSTCEQPSILQDEEPEADVPEGQEKTRADSQTPGTAEENDASSQGSVEGQQRALLESHPMNSYLVLNTKQMELRVSFDFPEYAPATQHINVVIDSSSIKAYSLFSRYHSYSKLGDSFQQALLATFSHPSFHIASLTHNNRADASLTDSFVHVFVFQ